MFGRPISARERRTITAAAIVSVVALAFAYGIVPFARRWSAREEAIAARREQLARLSWLARNEARLTRSSADRERSLDGAARRLLVGESASLALAQLQQTLQELAAESRLEVQQVDVAGTAGNDAASVSARLTAAGDVSGLAEFLEKVERGRAFLRVRELDVQPNPVRSDLLTIAVAVSAPFVQP